MWPSRYCCSPRSGCARSWRQSNTRQFGCPASCSVETRVVYVLEPQLAVQPLVEMHLGVFHRRLVGAGVVEALLVQRAPAAVQTRADLVVLDRGLHVGRLLRL